MGIDIKDNIWMEYLMGGVSIVGRMNIYTMESGEMVKCMVRSKKI
jgi:hypothetical protein